MNGNHLIHFAVTFVVGVDVGSEELDGLIVASVCNLLATRLPTFKISKKCNGIPIAENITAICLPNDVRGIGAPKP